MKLPRRRFLHLAACAVALPAASRLARAQAYPTRPVRIIVGQAAGSSSDITARLVAQWVSERLGQQFIIEVRPGAGGNIATEAAVGAPADGYTILLVNAQNTINSALYERLNFNFLRDIAPVVGIDRVPIVMEVHPSFPAKTVAEFIAHAKANPGKINMASAGIGGPQHVAGELFKFMASVDRPDGWSGAGDVRRNALVPSAYQWGQAAAAGGGDRDAIGRAARCSGSSRFFARL